MLIYIILILILYYPELAYIISKFSTHPSHIKVDMFQSIFAKPNISYITFNFWESPIHDKLGVIRYTFINPYISSDYIIFKKFNPDTFLSFAPSLLCYKNIKGEMLNNSNNSSSCAVPKVRAGLPSGGVSCANLARGSDMKRVFLEKKLGLEFTQKNNISSDITSAERVKLKSSSNYIESDEEKVMYDRAVKNFIKLVTKDRFNTTIIKFY